MTIAELKAIASAATDRNMKRFGHNSEAMTEALKAWDALHPPERMVELCSRIENLSRAISSATVYLKSFDSDPSDPEHQILKGFKRVLASDGVESAVGVKS